MAKSAAAGAASPGAGAPPPATPARSARDYQRVALDLLRAGRRPTADLLVREAGGGSKTTALSALNDFWDRWLPAYLGSFQPDAPDPVGQALRQVWAIAMEHAEAKIADRLSGDQRELKQAQARLLSDQQALAAAQGALDQQRDALANELSELHAKVSQAQLQLADARRDREQAEQAAARAERQEADAKADAARLQHELEFQRAAYATLQVRHREERAELQTIASDLKHAYHESEQRLRFQLDAEKTAHKNTEKALRREITNLEARLARALTSRQTSKKVVSPKRGTGARKA